MRTFLSGTVPLDLFRSLASRKPICNILLTWNPVPVFNVCAALNLSNTGGGKRVKFVRFLTDHSVDYLWVNNVEVFGKTISRLFVHKLLKVAEHSFRARFCRCNSARAQGSQRNKYAVDRTIQRLFYLLNTRTICAIFLYIWTQSIDGFNVLLHRYIRKANDTKNPAILSFFFVTERAQLNAAHA